MKTLDHLVILFLFVALTSCTSAPKAIVSPKFTETPVSGETMQPTLVVVPTELAFATPVIQVLRQSGLSILSVQSSTYTAMFPSTDKAVWVKTDEGIVEVIIFDDPSEVEQIHITKQPNQAEGRRLYTIQAPAPTLLHDQTIDAAFPLYFTRSNDMLLVTSSEELDKSLKQIFSGQ